MNARSRVRAHLHQLQVAALASQLAGCVAGTSKESKPDSYAVVDPMPESYCPDDPCLTVYSDAVVSAVWDASGQVVLSVDVTATGASVALLSATATGGAVTSTTPTGPVLHVVVLPDAGVTAVGVSVALSCDGCAAEGTLDLTADVSGTPGAGVAVPVTRTAR